MCTHTHDSCTIHNFMYLSLPFHETPYQLHSTIHVTQSTTDQYYRIHLTTDHVRLVKQNIHNKISFYVKENKIVTYDLDV